MGPSPVFRTASGSSATAKGPDVVVPAFAGSAASVHARSADPLAAIGERIAP